MNSLSLLVLLAVAVTVFGQGFPTRKCPPGEHSVLYCPRVLEPSCANPDKNNLIDKFGACDIPDCFCDSPTVRDTKSGKCVPLSQC